jgi:hypothetical protein
VRVEGKGGGKERRREPEIERLNAGPKKKKGLMSMTCTLRAREF